MNIVKLAIEEMIIQITSAHDPSVGASVLYALTNKGNLWWYTQWKDGWGWRLMRNPVQEEIKK